MRKETKDELHYVDTLKGTKVRGMHLKHIWLNNAK